MRLFVGDDWAEDHHDVEGARRPDGDAVQFDVRDEAANPVLGRCVTSALIAPG